MNAPHGKSCPNCGDDAETCRKRGLARTVVALSRAIVREIRPERLKDIGFALVMWDTEEEPTVVQFSTFNGEREGIAEVLDHAAQALRDGTHNLVRDPGDELPTGKVVN
jgi:hypothetical protein